MKLLNQLCWLRWAPLTGLMLLSGCSLLGDGGTPPATPPMIGAAEPEETAPKARQKYRFASEVSNTRKDHLAARRQAASPELSGAVIAQTRSSAPSQLASAPPGSYPSTGIPDFSVTAAPGQPLTQRLPDVRQASYGEHAAY